MVYRRICCQISLSSKHWRPKLRSSSASHGNDRQKGYVAYWTALGTFLVEHNTPFKIRTPPRDYWCSFGNIGRPGFLLVASAGFRDRKLGVEIYFSHRLAKLAFDHFEGERQDIEAEFGGALDWQRMDERRACRIAIYRTDFDPANQEQRPKQHEWYLKQLNSFVSVFRRAH
jgi:hypothetical protein